MTGQSRIDTWQTLEKSTSSTRNRLTHQPIQVQGKSRIDTWQNKEISTSKTRSDRKVFHQPVQITGKSRLDTWQKESFSQRRRHRSLSPEVDLSFSRLHSVQLILLLL